MASALISGMIRARVVERPDQIAAFDPYKQTLEELAARTGVSAAVSNQRMAQSCLTIVLAVKPQNMDEAMRELHASITPDHLIISIAAGVGLSRLRKGLGPCRIVRAMPNTPALIGEGAAGYCLAEEATEADEVRVKALLDSVGRAHRVPESMIDAVTGLAGSGPAFVFAVVEALSDGGVEMGLTRTVSTALAAQTVLGAARLVLESGLHPAVLKEQVTSPGGTTIAGLHALERGGLSAAIMHAVQAATLRSQELGLQAKN
jgi:pyrroline-5-carboxylate reductase